LRARGTASNGSQAYENVSGTFTMTGGRVTGALPLGRYRIRGELEY
jgi:hypothetical protein